MGNRRYTFWRKDMFSQNWKKERHCIPFNCLEVQCHFVTNSGLFERKIVFQNRILELKNSLLRDILFLYFLAEKWRCDMAVSYKKLFHLLIEKNMTNAQLQQEAGFSANIITRLKRGGYISLESVESICRVLNCGVDDILEFIPEDNGGKENG